MLASLGTQPGSFYLNLSILLFDKGKPRESGGRKAMGLPLRDPRDHDRQAAENKSIGLRTSLSAFISEENYDAQHTNHPNHT